MFVYETITQTHLNVLTQPRSVCLSLAVTSAHTQFESEIAGLVFLPSKEHFGYLFSLSHRMKNNFHGTRLYIYHGGCEANVSVVFYSSVISAPLC